MEYLQVLFPSVAIGVIFYFIMRWLFSADRREREALKQFQEKYATDNPEANTNEPSAEANELTDDIKHQLDAPPDSSAELSSSHKKNS